MASNKGSNFERQIAKELSLWATNGKNDDIFWRSSQSGGRATTRAKEGKKTINSAGDISFLDSIGQPLLDYFVIELKRGYGGSKITNKKEIMDIIVAYDDYNFSDSIQRKKIENDNKTNDFLLFCTNKIINKIRKNISNQINVSDILDSNLKNLILIDWIKKLKEECKFHDKPAWLLIFKRNNREICVAIDYDILNDLVWEQDEKILHKEYISIRNNKDIGNVFIFKYQDFFNWLDYGTIKLILEKRDQLWQN